jgi:excinuclease ABC subunit B
MYADRITGSMQKALDEMERRRKIQIEYNKKHGITPKGIEKAVHDIMEGAYSTEKDKIEKLQIEDEYLQYLKMPPNKLARKLEQLEKKMYQHAKNLEFEEAANLRDQIHKIREEVFGQ